MLEDTDTLKSMEMRNIDSHIQILCLYVFDIYPGFLVKVIY